MFTKRFFEIQVNVELAKIKQCQSKLCFISQQLVSHVRVRADRNT